jgi:hypothetical protein
MHKLISSTVSNSSIAWSQQWLGEGQGCTDILSTNQYLTRSYNGMLWGMDW